MRLRHLMILLMSAALLVFLAPNAMAEDDLARVAVTIDGNTLNADAFIINGRTVAPLRAIFEALGATVEWDPATRTVTGTKGTTVIKLTIDQTEAHVGDKTVTLSVPALIINARTFVPVRFIAEALGTDVQFDTATRTVVISSGMGCKLPGGQKHEGTIAPGGETWGLCGSPHIISSDFRIEGKDTPVLTIEAGTLVQFEHGASFVIGQENPGGIVVEGTTDKPVTFTSAQQGAMPGSWNGFRFYSQTDKTHASIQNARVESAGGSNNGAITLDASNYENRVEVLLKNVEIKNSAWAGLYLWGNAHLAAGSTGLKITGTKSLSGDGGYAIITGSLGSDKLPAGTYTGNEQNAVHVTDNGTITLGTSTTWRNIGVPYVFTDEVQVGGTASPTLTIEPGVITLWDHDASLQIGRDGPGSLVANAKAQVEGTGDWTIGKTELEAAVKLADGNVAASGPACSLCASNHVIVFGSLNTSPQRGAWQGIQLFSKAGTKTQLVGVVVAYGGQDNEDWSGGVYADAQTPVKFLLANSLITQAPHAGLMLWNQATLAPGSTGNIFTGNQEPVRLEAKNISVLDPSNTYTGNDNDWIDVWGNGYENFVTTSATWKNQGVPYYFLWPVQIGGSSKPVVTIEPGTTLIMSKDAYIDVGYNGMGSLSAVGTADKPITFTAEAQRSGSWRGLKFTDDSGNSNKLEHVVIEYADTAVEVDVDLGGFLKNSTIRMAKTIGIQRDYDLAGGTDYLTGMGVKFEANTVDENINQ